LAGSGILLGAQDCHWATRGAYTGAVSPAQVADAGARVVILGHSERRALFAETDEIVGQKVAAALAAGLVPLVCVGETAAAREAGGLVGGASLKALDFIGIVRAAPIAKGRAGAPMR